MSERPGPANWADVVAASPHTIPRALDQAEQRFGERPWLVFEDERRTFAEMASEVKRISSGLITVGVEQGETIGLFLGNCVEWLEIEYAVTGIGACFVPMNTWFRSRELEHIADTARLTTLVWGSSVLGAPTLPLLEDLLPELRDAGPGEWRSERFPNLRRVIGVGDGPWPQGVLAWASMLSGAETTDDGVLDARRRAVKPEDPALLMFTSGTTGAPKGAVLSHIAIVDHVALWVDALGVTKADRSIIGSPLFWTFGCALTGLTTLLAGSMVALLQRFEAEEFLRVIRDERITHLQGVPSQYEMMLARAEAEDADISALRIIQIGGSISAEGLARRLLARAPDARFITAYGLTEAVAVATWTLPDATMEDVMSTVGPVSPDLEWKLCDPETSEPVLTGEVGELWLRGNSVLLGYLRDGNGNLEPPADGWLHTGDLMRADERGYLTVVGRSVDAFKRGGMNVYPAEAEALLMEHPEIDLVAVVGVPDDRLGEVGAAFVVPAHGAEIDAEELIAWSAARIARYKVPAHLRIVDSLPTTPTGKIRKVGLRGSWEAGEFDAVAGGAATSPDPVPRTES